ncbi:amidohydrolase [Williamsia sp. CHRR-6]|uniref:amidohydrolase n=1 Tax=Williamsia sp. CHRR-6 TaxID=2835871 RepID=UPI001BD97FAB|nr:amidohydrolase [Williamsia sp. CHRR-6]MBT0568135.1 amidohydrolase [Williamsia sp. CHRR-6]
MGTQLFVGGHVYSPQAFDATSMAVTDGVISWIGSDQVGRALHPQVPVTDLDGAFVAPAFVDSHVHLTSTGLSLNGLDLSDATSRADCLTRLREYAATTPPGELIWGLGWDDSTWTDHASPTTDDVDAIVGNRPVYLARIDEHSAVASTALRTIADKAADAAGFDPQQPLTAEAHHLVRAAARGLLTAEQRTRAQRRALDEAAANGIVAVHENGGPDISGLADFVAIGALDHAVQVRRYWGQAVTDVDAARSLLAATGADGLGGDLFIDGAIGSHTAWLTHPYADDLHNHGVSYLDEDAVIAHLRACTEAEVQAGFHLIGDAATDCLTRALRVLLAEFGSARVARCHHRIEHAEMVGPDAAAVFADAGMTASMQPIFDALWGGPGQLYEQRLGGARAAGLNDFAGLARAGVNLAFSSDSPVTAMNPWQQIRAAVNHHNPDSAVSPRAAFAAVTRGGWRAAGVADGTRGVLMPGAPADYAIWRVENLVTAGSSEKVQRWSTDPRARVPALPDMSPGAALPVCVQTVRAGQPIHLGAT